MKTKREQRGANNPNWRGGKTLMKDGRVLIYAPEHPDANAIGGLYILEYRLIAEKKIGRRLLPEEIVHHVNGDITDNRPENLEVMTQAEHVKKHSADVGQRCKFTQDIIDKIIMDKRLLREIAADYGATVTHICHIKNHGIRRPAINVHI